MVNVFYNLKALMLQKCKELLPDKLERGFEMGLYDGD